jgi:hypothetical protein
MNTTYTVQYHQMRYELKGSLPSYVQMSPLFHSRKRSSNEDAMEVFHTLVINKITRPDGEVDLTITIWSDTRLDCMTQLFQAKKTYMYPTEEELLAFIKQVLEIDMKGILPFINYPVINELNWKEFKDSSQSYSSGCQGQKDLQGLALDLFF